MITSEHDATAAIKGSSHYHNCLALAVQHLPGMVICQKDGSIGFNACVTYPSLDDIQDLLASAMPVASDVPYDNRSSMVWSAFKGFGADCAKGVKPDVAVLESHLREQVTGYQKKPRQRFYLFTQISIHQSAIENLESRCGCALLSLTKLRPANMPDESKLCLQLRSLNVHQPRADWAWLQIEANARDWNVMFGMSMTAVNLWRGKLNFAKNRRFYSSMSFPAAKPINAIQLGPLQIVIRATDGEVSPMWQFQNPVAGDSGQPWRPRPSELQSLLKYVDSIEQNPKAARKDYRRALEECIVNYTNTLDDANYSEVFPKLWTIAETLTNCSESGRANHDLLIRRATKCCGGGKLFAITFEHLRAARHSVIHDFKVSFSQETTFQLLRLVHELLLFHFQSCPDLHSMHEAGRYLDLPIDEKVLRREIELRQRLLQELIAEDITALLDAE
jgi:hypothetical protein